MATTATGARHEAHAWHFFIYDVLYIAILGAVIYELLRKPETWQLWTVESSIVGMYAVDCLYTRAYLRSFDPDQAQPSENVLNACIPIGMGLAFSFAMSQHFIVTFACLGLLVLMALIVNARYQDWTAVLSLDVELLVMYCALGVLAYGLDWLSQWWTVALSWLPTVYYAIYAGFSGKGRRLRGI